MDKLKGYVDATGGVADPMKGYDCLYECDFSDMFEAFETMNNGVVGGARTVNDYTIDGLEGYDTQGGEDDDNKPREKDVK